MCVDAEPARVRARLSKRDTIAQDDQVVLFLDTFHDRQRAYLFAVNPLGAHIARSTVNFQFTRALSARTIVDYNAVIPNPALSHSQLIGSRAIFAGRLAMS